MPQAHHFAIAFAEELVEMRKLSREELVAGEAIESRDVLAEKPGGQGRADRFGIVIAPSAARRIAVLGCVHRSELTRWIWSDGLPPMRVLVAAHLDGYPRRPLPDAD